MRYLKRFESIGSPLLNLYDNVDMHLISVIQDNVKIGSKILEISCGNASDSIYLKNLGYDVTCTEFNPDYVNNANKKGIRCIKHDTKNKFPFGDNEFDIIYCRLGLHYFNEVDLVNIFSELCRIGDKILITVKITDDIKTGKIILSTSQWLKIISRFFNIQYCEEKEGILYDSKTKWIEIFAKRNSINENLNIYAYVDDFKDVVQDISDNTNYEIDTNYECKYHDHNCHLNNH